ncbi:PAP2 superfamily-domain-containing protein [Emericellopsis atlantica]|uniref:PAP2 superfamily-domain-containing protein n=1 Tax=Emericellopsis atlantica TaxID=2614577 RepID=A0A9P7ZPZ6_9HYPO|nr:PAP2 superfamily-domain-containing protein [Emericellopsis atlantica]KAG9256189.1 PAP2 superfamily-domain-containing protein [Emericellopsis atlantica]
MSVLSKTVLEPIVIVCLFTAGCLINRRRDSRSPIDVENRPLVRENGDPSTQSSSLSSSPSLSAVDDSHQRNIVWELLRRFWRKYPFLPEIWYWNLTYWVYQGLRAVSARLIADNASVFERAKQHALTVLSIEQLLGIDVELSVQRFFLNNYPDWMSVLGNIYHSHICVGIAFLVYTYTYLPFPTYQRIRRTIAMDNAVAFVIVTLWRCSPPRLLPEEYGFVDILHPKVNPNDNPWQNNRFQLTIAAMPSLHFGTALFFAVSLYRFAPHAVVRVLAPLWPAMMLLTIVTTANHFLMDAMVGACVPLVGWRLEWMVGELAVVQNWVFGPIARRMGVAGAEEERARAVPGGKGMESGKGRMD